MREVGWQIKFVLFFRLRISVLPQDQICTLQRILIRLSFTVNNPAGGEWKSVAPHTLNTCNQIFLQRPATAATEVYPAAAAVAPVQESATSAPSIVGHPHHQYHQGSPVRIVKSPPIGEIATSVAPPPNIGVSGRYGHVEKKFPEQ